MGYTMEWIRNIALFLVFSEILLELVADTKYYKYAKWVVGMILLLQFIKPWSEKEIIWERFITSFSSFDYALGTDRVLEELYQVDGQMEEAVLEEYRKTISEQIDRLLRKSGLALSQAEISVAEDGTMTDLQVQAVYVDGRKESGTIWIPTVAPVKLSEVPQTDIISPMELYIREILAEFYQMEENKISVVIQEAD